MGWTTMPIPSEGARAYLDRNIFSYDRPDRKLEVLRSVIVDHRTYYAACRRTNKQTGVIEVFAGVALVTSSLRERESFGYETMTEHDGPCEARCPAAILNVLSATLDEGAIKWRRRCRDYHAKPRLIPGHYVHFATPIEFVNNHNHSTMLIAARGKSGRGRAFIGLDDGISYRISRLHDRAYTVTPHASEVEGEGQRRRDHPVLRLVR